MDGHRSGNLLGWMLFLIEALHPLLSIAGSWMGKEKHGRQGRKAGFLDLSKVLAKCWK